MTIRQVLLFCLCIGVLWGIAPAVIWFASGSRRQAWEAAKGYGFFLLFIAGSMLLGVVVFLFEWLMS